MSKKITFTDDQKRDIKDKYLIHKKTINEISKSYGVSVTPISSFLKDINVPIRKPQETSRKYFLDESYFDDINTEDRAYFLGLLLSDGYNNEKRGAVTLILKQDDKRILDIFSDCISTDKPIINVKNKNGSLTSRMEICSKNISEKLASYGCVQAKTFKVSFPDFLNSDSDLVRHFIRGFFDGDGCISYSFSRRSNYFGNSFLSVATFTSTDIFCEGLKKYIKDNLGINSTLLCRNPKRNNNIRTLQISGNKQVIKLMKWMYNGTDLYLKRKYLKYLSIIDILDERSEIVSRLRSKTAFKNITKYNKGRKTK